VISFFGVAFAKTAEHFRQLCLGQKLLGTTKNDMAYVNSTFHRMIPASQG